jgi:hypothetical protein
VGSMHTGPSPNREAHSCLEILDFCWELITQGWQAHMTALNHSVFVSDLPSSSSMLLLV